MRPTVIDLFAGAGGLSLGLTAAGFEHVLAVEKSPMAAETYYMNLIQRDPAAWEEHRDRFDTAHQIRTGLAVRETGEVLSHLGAIRERLGSRQLDLLAGGPPCQGFSLAGLRNPDDRRNELPFEFLGFVDALQPRSVLIENVTGIGMDFADGKRSAPLKDLRQALANKGYLAQILEVNARDFRVAQRRPRIMILGLRLDTAAWLLPKLSLDNVREVEPARWSSSGRVRESERLYGRDITGGILTPEDLVVRPGRDCDSTVADALDDLSCSSTAPSSYVRLLERRIRVPAGKDPEGPANQERRNHGPRATARFQLYLALAPFGVSSQVFSKSAEAERTAKRLRGAGADVPEWTHATQVRQRIVEELQKCRVPQPLHFDGRPIIAPNLVAGSDNIGKDHAVLADAIMALASLKHSQRALDASAPAPAVLSLPDDFVHHREPRTLTVREMARLQSFPDGFRFYSKVTTGGVSRRVDVPQYTQVGNAVPPLMAYGVGLHLRRLIARSDLRRAARSGS